MSKKYRAQLSHDYYDVLLLVTATVTTQLHGSVHKRNPVREYFDCFVGEKQFQLGLVNVILKMMGLFDAAVGALVGESGCDIEVTGPLTGNYLATAGKGGALKIFTSDDYQPVATIQCQDDQIICFSFSPDGALLVAGSTSFKVRVWDFGGNRLLMTGKHSNRVVSVAFSRTGDRVVSRSIGGSLMVWDAQTGQRLVRINEEFRQVCPVLFSNDGERILTSVTGSPQNQYGQDICVWNSRTGEPITRLQAHRGYIHSIVKSEETDLIASASCDNGIIYLWDLGTGGTESTRELKTSTLVNISLSQDGTILVGGRRDSIITLWNTGSGEVVNQVTGFRGLSWMCMNPSGTQIACGADDKVHVIDIASESEVMTISYVVPYHMIVYSCPQTNILM
jgi:WD40 repeat protein